MLGFALFCLYASQGVAIVEEASNKGDSITCSLEEYKGLYRQAYLQELKRNSELENQDVQKELDRGWKDLEAARDARSSSVTMRKDRSKVLAGNWQLVNHTAMGLYQLASEPAERSMATYEFSLDFRIFEDEWTAIPIIDSQTIVSDWRVTRASGYDGRWEDIELGYNTLLVLRRRETEDVENAFHDHTFVTNSSGRYKVWFRIFTHVRSNRNLFTLQLNMLYPLAHTNLRLHHQTGSSHVKELNVEPAAFVDIVKPEKGNYSDVHIVLPSATKVEVQWKVQTGAHSPKSRSSTTTVAGSEELQETEKELEGQSAQATVSHDSLHSIADGILQSAHIFKYQLDSVAQSLSKVEIVVLSPARVASVVAHGMQTWRADTSKNITLPSDASSSAGNVSGTVIVIVFKSSVIAKDIVVKVSTEQEFDADAGSVTLPVAVCRDVLRQTGTLAVIKVANVEVYGQSARGVTKIGADEVPAQIRSGTGRPIILAYKYLSPRHSIEMSVIHHEELHTLEAVADSALHQVLVQDTQAMYAFSLLLQNMQRQYMEIRGIPASATLWSLKVNSLDTKPVRGRDGAFMVPLLVGPQGDKTSIEMAWLGFHDPLGATGTMDLRPPQIDVPMTSLSVDVQFPDGYKLNFTGSLSSVEQFSQRQPRAVNYETGQDVVPSEFDFGSMAPPKSPSSKSGIKAKVPKIVKRHLFEKLFVINGSATLQVVYWPEKGNATSSWFNFR